MSSQKTNDLKLKTARTNCGLFSRLYIGCQVRGGDLKDFFAHENQSFPPSVAEYGYMWQCSKSDSLQCFWRNHDPVLGEPQVSAVVIDSAVLVHILKPGQAQTFQDYSNSVFLPYTLMSLATVDRVGIVWDCYRDDSRNS